MRRGWMSGLVFATLCALLWSPRSLRAQNSTDAKPAAVVELREPDARYKVDVLVVVAHPDDEGAATAYLARAIDEGKRVAVVYGTRGGNGGNEVGTEQAAGLAV